MPKLNHTGPDGKGSKTGRKLGRCKKDTDQTDFSLGQGLGKRRKENGGTGQGKRLKSSKLFDNNK